MNGYKTSKITFKNLQYIITLKVLAVLFLYSTPSLAALPRTISHLLLVLYTEFKNLDGECMAVVPL